MKKEYLIGLILVLFTIANMVVYTITALSSFQFANIFLALATIGLLLYFTLITYCSVDKPIGI